MASGTFRSTRLWQPSRHWQLDMGSVAGLDRTSPDIEFYAGISRRF